MRKIIPLVAVLVLSFTSFHAEASNTAQSTALGAVAGAAIGQAIGHNTEATLIGIAVGGVSGYIVGNEMDKNGHVRQARHVRPTRVWSPGPSRQGDKHIIVIVDPERRNHHQHKRWCKHHYKHSKHHKKWRRPYRGGGDNHCQCFIEIIYR